MNVELHPIKTNDYKDDEITRVVMKHSNKGEYHTGFRDGRDVTVCAVLEIVDEVADGYKSPTASGLGHGVACKEIRKRVLKMRGDKE